MPSACATAAARMPNDERSSASYGHSRHPIVGTMTEVLPRPSFGTSNVMDVLVRPARSRGAPHMGHRDSRELVVIFVGLGPAPTRRVREQGGIS
jgi:hypothetical protein